MNKQELNQYLRRETDAFPGKVSLLVGEVEGGGILHSLAPDTQVVSASTIKVPVLLAALEAVRQGKLDLRAPLDLPVGSILEDSEVFEYGPTSRSLWELLYWMIVESDNTATNRVLEAVGFEAVNTYARRTLGLRHTLCERRMLDWDAIRAGRNNYTSASDQFRMYRLLCRGELLDRGLTAVALDLLRRQRSMDGILRYIPVPVDFAHKPGGLDFLNHDAGVFFQPDGAWFLGIFTWDGPSPEGDKRQKMFIGRLARAIYQVYGTAVPPFCQEETS